MQLVLLILAIVVCPFAYIALLLHIRSKNIPDPPVASILFLFGTVGGWLLVFALSPSGIAATGIIFLITIIPIGLLFSSSMILAIENKTIYHKVPMWFGFAYPAILAIVVSVLILNGDMM